MKINNWTKVVIILLSLILLMLIPFTRAALLFILPLGSGIDDLIFFILLILLAIVLLMKILMPGFLQKIAKWFKG